MARAADNFGCFQCGGRSRGGGPILNYLALQRTARSGEIVDSLGAGAAVGFESTCAFLLEVGACQRAPATAGRMLYRNQTRRRSGRFHEWTETFERYWRHQLSRVKERAEQKKAIRQTIRDRILIQGGKNDHDSNKN